MWEADQTSLLNLRGEAEEYGTDGAITGDGEGIEQEMEGDRHPPHVRSPPTFQPWWHLYAFCRRVAPLKAKFSLVDDVVKTKTFHFRRHQHPHGSIMEKALKV